jgi:uncharacterized membrane protein YvbJ
MKFCKNCEKETPTKKVDGEEECMVCGTIITENKFVNMRLTKELKKLTKKKENSKNYNSAQVVGRNVLIGILLIISGILYGMGGIELVLTYVIGGIIGLAFFAIILFLIAIGSD